MIVLVDNETPSRQALAEKLGALGHKVSAFASSERLPPLPLLWCSTMLVTRYELPGESGLALADRFHVGYPSIPIVLLTSASSPILERRARLCRFLSVWEEPLDYEELPGVIDVLHQEWQTNRPAEVPEDRVQTVHRLQSRAQGGGISGTWMPARRPYCFFSTVSKAAR